MHFTSVLAVSASILALGYAAEPLAFTDWPKDIQAGKPVTLTWAGAATNEPVTLTLRKGNAGDLENVETITDKAKDGSFTWTPGDNIEEGGDYAFQVTQNGQSNYSDLLKAGPQVPSASDTTQTGTPTSSSAPSTDSTSATETTPSTTSKPLISSAASATPSSSPASTSVVSSTVTAKGPLMTSTDVVSGKDASSTGGMQSGVASAPKYSLELLVGAMGLLVYLVQ